MREPKKKVDLAALQSAFMRVPHMPVAVARYLLDAGYTDLFQLSGRSAESLLAEIRKHDFLADEKVVLPALRLAIYFSENQSAPDKSLLNLHAWE
ncbi:MAG: hypothetical protein IJN19_04250 [Opitutales bacterium]|nr:hypothetical protein [Opitutales bacterium]